jgi:hypothetical protein
MVSFLYGNTTNIEPSQAEPEPESKEKTWNHMPELTKTPPGVYSRVDSNTFTRVDLNPMPESTLSPSQGLWIWPRKRIFLVPLQSWNF